MLSIHMAMLLSLLLRFSERYDGYNRSADKVQRFQLRCILHHSVCPLVLPERASLFYPACLRRSMPRR